MLRAIFFSLIVLSFSGCAHFEGLDSAFARESARRNRIAIGWAVIKPPTNSTGDALPFIRASLTNAQKRLRDEGYLLSERPARLIQLDANGRSKEALEETTLDLIRLHQTAIKDPNHEWTQQLPAVPTAFVGIDRYPKMTNALTQKIAWPPPSFGAEELTRIDTVLFLAVDFQFEPLEEAKARRRRNWIVAPLVIATTPFAFMGGRVPNSVAEGSASWIRVSAVLLNASDGRILYRHHKHFRHDDARDADTLREDIIGALGELPNAK